MDATEAIAPVELGERLRELGNECAWLIVSDPRPFEGEGDWLRTLPICQAMVEHDPALGADERDRPVLMAVDLGGDPISHDGHGHHLLVLDDESETNRILGPVIRRLQTAWTAATFRFVRRPHDRYFDFCLVDARRIALLAALTFNADFNGSAVGLNLPWDHPRGCAATFEGRGWAWSITTAEAGVEPRLLELIEKALEYLRGTMPLAGTGGHASPPGVANDVLTMKLMAAVERIDAITSRIDGHMPPEGDSQAQDEAVPQDATSGQAAAAGAALSPSLTKALASFVEARRRWPDLVPVGPGGRPVPTDKLHEQLAHHGCKAYPGKPPAAETWRRYVREALMRTEGRVNSRRAGRPHGSSIVRTQDVDPTRAPD